MLYKYNLDIITENELVKIILCNNINGYDIINIYFPLKLFIIDNFIWSYYFCHISLISNLSNNNIDFFCILNKKINETYKMSFLLFDQVKYNINKIIKISFNEYLSFSFNENNLDQYNKYFWEFTNLQINIITILYNLLYGSYQNIEKIKLKKNMNNKKFFDKYIKHKNI